MAAMVTPQRLSSSHDSEYQTITTKNEASGSRFDTVDDDAYGAVRQPPSRRSWAATIALQLLSVLWLAPIAGLLWLNGSGYIIGPSAWCPFGDCGFNGYSWNATAQMVELADRDRDLLGALQFVAKALEIWFVLISGALVYLVTMRLASRREGLPIGYLTKSMEFALPAAAVSTLSHLQRRNKAAPTHTRGGLSNRGVWLLALLSGIVFVLCTLMGPATAVLVIPALQWLKTPPQDLQRLTSSNYDTAPLNSYASWFYNTSVSCTPEQYATQKYSCVQQPYGDSLDAWVNNYIVNNGTRNMATESLLTFSFNYTQTGDFTGLSDEEIDALSAYWVPGRQVISSLSADVYNAGTLAFLKERRRASGLNDADRASLDKSISELADWESSSKAVKLELRRKGPIYGAILNSFVDRAPAGVRYPRKRAIVIDDQRVVICYSSYSPRVSLDTGNPDGNYTRCIRNGDGWSTQLKNGSSTWQRFDLQGRYTTSGKQGPSAQAMIFSSDKGVFLPNGTVPTWFDEECLNPNASNETLAGCDWERLFNEPPDAATRSRAGASVTLEYSLNAADNSSGVLFVVDFSALQGFTEYSLSTSPTDNPAELVRTETLPDSSSLTPIFVDPAWLLAGWTADSGGLVNPYRSTANIMMWTLEQLVANPKLTPQEIFGGDPQWKAVTVLPIMNALSLIDHTTSPATDLSVSSVKDLEGAAEQQLLYAYSRLYVWAYGFKSRSAWLGAVVAGLGAVVVLVQTVVGFIDRRRYRTPTQLLVSALEHVPQREFDGIPHKEATLATARFRVVDDETRAGKLRFGGHAD